MAVFRWGNAFDAFRDLEREMDHLLHSVNMAFEGLRIGRPFPAVNIYELEQEFLLTAELPGTRVEDLDLSVANGVLKLRGRRGSAPEVAEQQFRRSERAQGQWERSFTLPERVNEHELHAELQNGVLKLHLPKAPSAVPRQIPVSNGQTPSLPLTIEAERGASS
jgi:HSP20 family protein